MWGKDDLHSSGEMAAMGRLANGAGLLVGVLAAALMVGVPQSGLADGVQPDGAEAPARPTAQPDALQDRVDQLIRQLGHDSFAMRQRASKQLVEIGIAGQPQLSAALADDDAEVRNRSAHVLSQVVEADFRARLEAFANDPLGKKDHSLPSWNRYRETFGQDKAPRDLFVDMQRAEPALLDSLEASPKLAGELLVMRMQSILQTIQWPQLNGGQPAAIPFGTVCALLFVSSTEGVTITDQDAIQLFNLIHQASFQSNLRTSANGPMLKKLLGMWILHNSGPSIAYMNLQLAFNCDLKEGLDLAVKMIGNDGGGQPFMRQYVILAIARFGNHEHIPLVEPLLKDATPCMPQQNPDPKQSQIRDVALAVLIKLSGQELKDYGLEHVQTNPQTVFQPGTVTFGDSAKREAALAKWKVWAQQQPKE
jgi:hypothetical protein